MSTKMMNIDSKSGMCLVKVLLILFTFHFSLFTFHFLLLTFHFSLLTFHFHNSLAGMKCCHCHAFQAVEDNVLSREQQVGQRRTG